MAMRDALLVIHIICVAAWLGANLVLAFAGPMAVHADASARRWWAEVQGKMGKIYYNIAGILILITGVILVIDSNSIEFSSMFISIGFLAVIIGALLGIFVFGPGSREIVSAIDSGDRDKEHAVNNRLTTMGIIDTLVMVLAIVAMVGHWGL